jgi:hypothetical protein
MAACLGDLARCAGETPLTTHSSGAERVLGSSSSILDATKRLLTLIRLENAIIESPTDRRRDIQDTARAITKLWEKHAEIGEEQFKSEIGEIISPEAMVLYDDSGDLNELVRRIMNDVQSLITSPLKRSVRGNQGPTFLVAHSTPTLGSMESYVMKWTGRNELCANHIYQAFGNGFVAQFPSSSIAA